MAIAQDVISSKDENEEEIFYPISDGKPMAESDLHQLVMIYCVFALRTHYADDPDVYVSGNNFLYYVEGNARQVVSPDCYVVFGVGSPLRDTYKVWEEGGQKPAVVIEITSKSTKNEDMGRKFKKYKQDLKVKEYFLFDPTGDYLQPTLQGYRLVNGQYVRIPFQTDRLVSEQLGLELVVQEEDLRFYDPKKGRWMLTPQEALDQAEAERQKADMERQKAERAQQQAEIERKRADTEANARQEAEAEIAQLCAEIEALRKKS